MLITSFQNRQSLFTKFLKFFFCHMRKSWRFRYVNEEQTGTNKDLSIHVRLSANILNYFVSTELSEIFELFITIMFRGCSPTRTCHVHYLNFRLRFFSNFALRFLFLGKLSRWIIIAKRISKFLGCFHTLMEYSKSLVVTPVNCGWC